VIEKLVSMKGYVKRDAKKKAAYTLTALKKHFEAPKLTKQPK